MRTKNCAYFYETFSYNKRITKKELHEETTGVINDRFLLENCNLYSKQR